MRRLPIGYHHSDEVRQKISESRKGKTWSDESRQAASEVHKAHWRELDSTEKERHLAKLKISRIDAVAGIKKRWQEPEFRQRMAALKRRPGTGRPREDAETRFMRFVKILENGCWEWTGKLSKDGYGQFSVPDGKKGKSVPAHKWIYEKNHNSIPIEKECDHICHSITNCLGGRDCRHRRCVNPTHIVPSTKWENLIRSHSVSARNARKTHCYKGHALTADNVRMRDGYRECKICAKAKWTRANQRKSTLRYQLKEAQEKIKELEAKLK